MSQTFVAETELTTINCSHCGGTYAISERYRACKQVHSGYWTCPYCNRQIGYGEREIDKVRNKMEAEQAARLKAEDAKRQAEIQRDINANELAKTDQRLTMNKRKLAKLKKRIEDGACPCCHERFPDLEEHIKSKHPGYGKKRKTVEP